MVRSRLRSSKVALIEHIEGSKKVMEEFGFDGKSIESGDKLKIIKDIINLEKLPFRHKKFKSEYFPDWLINLEKYKKACEEEYHTYTKIAKLARKLSHERELGKVAELVEISKTHDNVLAFDSTVITLYYLRKLFKENYPASNILVASGSEKDSASEKVLEFFKLDSEIKGKCIALCSDKMAESVDLQRASCVFLLDTPSVLRIVEQRIGRADRMDSMHKSIDIYWAVDSDEYAMKTDERLFETNDLVEQIYGSNFDLPEALKGRRFKQTGSTDEMIREFKEFVDKDESWTGIHDSFQVVVNLKEGDTAIIDEKLYEQFTNVSSEVKTKVSFIECETNWCFIALRGDSNKSPRWYFIDSLNNIHIDYPDVCQQLRDHIKGTATTLEWDQKRLEHYIRFFQSKERDLLPPKKKRALEVAEYILQMKQKYKGIAISEKNAYKDMLKVLTGKSSETFDFERLAEEWIQLLQPYLKTKRENLRRKRTILNLNSLKSSYKEMILDPDYLSEMLERCMVGDEIDKRIAACIIGTTSQGRTTL